MAHAYKLENRSLNSLPEYRYATGTLNIRYLLPTRNDMPVELRAKVISVDRRKTTLHCELFSDGQVTATAEVIAIRVFNSDDKNTDNKFT